ncbi:GNAT family N-acetyltransferase [Vagococcus sp. BWB3-3]|uniref:GNAT family N-acetyltransferase n=1 Tax=Vagococcus allomyrinae TaxID=2794353 RepID=A0A940SQY1_9ENTE|nr:GNAT family N-acetyltransferase [Vagococcus allomyrinae]MBP1040212.1 GNAT family N-acetyltransferase [Vagococcus allomyrinae]
MKPIFSFYTSADFGRVSQFIRQLKVAYLPYDGVRFQFTLGLHIDFVGNGLEGGFERTCGIWEDRQGIVALVMTEGGTQWEETFFLFRSDEDKSTELLPRMCEFAERFTSRVSADQQQNQYRLCLPSSDLVIANFLRKRGYQRTTDKERTLIKPYSDPEEVILPEGFTIHDGRTVTPFYTALAHNHSFRYNQENDGGQRGFEKIRQMPDYRPELDLVVFDPEGQPAGLANFWVSDKTDIAVLEPLGVVWWYRRLGLGKALITEGINRTRVHGCTQLIGGDQPFYWALGFEPQRTDDYWAWTSSS